MDIEFLASLLHWLGVLFYGGPLLLFAVLMPVAAHVAAGDPRQVDRVYRLAGPISGLGLGVLILGGLTRLYLRNGGFTWPHATAADRWMLAKHGVFFVLWVNYTILEVWTLEPLRRLDGSTSTDDEMAYGVARRKVSTHLVFNAALLLVVLVLGLLGWYAGSGC